MQITKVFLIVLEISLLETHLLFFLLQRLVFALNFSQFLFQAAQVIAHATLLLRLQREELPSLLSELTQG